MPDHAREDNVLAMLVGAWSMMMDDLARPRTNPVDDEGLKLLQGFVDEGSIIQGYTGDVCCQYCGCGVNGPHKPDCLWSRARAYLRDQGVEVKDSE